MALIQKVSWIQDQKNHKNSCIFHYISKSYKQIGTKFTGMMYHYDSHNPVNFGVDPNIFRDPGLEKPCKFIHFSSYFKAFFTDLQGICRDDVSYWHKQSPKFWRWSKHYPGSRIRKTIQIHAFFIIFQKDVDGFARNSQGWYIIMTQTIL